VFSLDEWTEPEGDTGAYLLYNLARIRSIQRKAETEPAGSESGAFGEALEERALIGQLLELPDAIRRATESSDPSVVCGWAYEVARAFSRFFNVCPVLKAEPELRARRLELVAATDRVLTGGLRLVGIEPVDSM
jgi:arginyl-tRNA synthetase